MNASPILRVSQTAAYSLAGILGVASSWCAARFARAPLTSTATVLVAVGYIVATGNALYGQAVSHPAPLFGAPTIAVPQPIAPVEAVPSLEQQGGAQPAAATPAPAAASRPSANAGQQLALPETAIGNPEVARLQQKLQVMGLFNGTVDGYYGPRTADAIRAFEERFGMPRTGAISPAVLQAVANAPLETSAAPVVATPAPAAPVAAAPVAAAPQAEASPVPALALIQSIGEQASTETVSDAVEEVAEIALAQFNQLDASEAVATPNMLENLFAMATRQQLAATGPQTPALDTELVSSVQRGLSQLGFLRAPVTGIVGDETARAIRNFEIFHNFDPSGTVSYALLDKLSAAGATL